ncbi:MAG: hypothetical protein JO297_05420, partial [Nitrososphaeraceae archaeon]|nr:hypothetical protein [Nitrososphaeraceae archaeon]
MANQNDRKEKYTILNPGELYHGKSSSDWAADWFNWFLSANADKRNSGPVVFLRSHGLPNRNSGAYISDIPSRSTVTDTSPSGSITDSDYPAIYVNDPNFRIGNEGLQIFDDQAVFVPIIVAYQLGGSVAPYRDWGYLQEYVGSLIDNGDNPPDRIQLTIDTEPINLTINGQEHGKEDETKLVMKDFRITTPIFMAVVPEAPYGTSIKDFLEEGSIPAGAYPASVDGYFVMLKFKNPGTYLV